MTKIYLYLIVFALLGSFVLGAVYYYKSSQATIQRLAAEKAILNGAVERQNATINEMEASTAKQQQLNSELQVKLQENESGLDEIRQKLSNHDLTKLAIARPGLIEERINNGTSEVFKQLESDTALPSN